MIAENLGYFKKEQVLEMFEKSKPFSIYSTNRKTQVLIIENKFIGNLENQYLYFPKEDRLPWKTVEGKKISRCEKRIFNSSLDDIKTLDTKNWNNGNQIMTYKEFSL